MRASNEDTNTAINLTKEENPTASFTVLTSTESVSYKLHSLGFISGNNMHHQQIISKCLVPQQKHV